MLRLVGFFVLAIVLARVLGHLPLIGPLFARTGFLGVWIAAILLSLAFTRYGERAVRVRRHAAEVRRLEAVESPHTRGKLGSLLLQQGRARRAIEPLRDAVQGEPDVPEWHYRLGTALAETGDVAGAVEALTRCLELDEEYAYGNAARSLATVLLRDDQPDAALARLASVERNHGPSPESAYLRGRAHKALGEKDEAAAAFDEVATLARNAARYQKGSASGWVLRAQLARWF